MDMIATKEGWPLRNALLLGAQVTSVPEVRRSEMHPEDVMKPDLFSEIVLIVVTALARA
jgi:hypothetical protein